MAEIKSKVVWGNGSDSLRIYRGIRPASVLNAIIDTDNRFDLVAEAYRPAGTSLPFKGLGVADTGYFEDLWGLVQCADVLVVFDVATGGHRSDPGMTIAHPLHKGVPLVIDSFSITVVAI